MPGSKSVSTRHRRLQQLRRFDQRLRRQHRLESAIIAGIDEVGRGPCAGPVVACAVVLHQTSFSVSIDDSKRLTPSARETAYHQICAVSDRGMGWVSPEEIDRRGIHAACHLAMVRAFKRLSIAPSFVFVDGPFIPKDLPVPALGIVGGDSKSLSIACASIVAKVLRDRFMRRLHRLYPEYGFHRHKGYGTPEHLSILQKIGPSSLHRYTFAPVRIVSENDLSNA